MIIREKKRQARKKTAPIIYRPGARSTYRPDYCQAVINYRSEGRSLAAFAGSIGITRSTLDDWMLKYPDFKEACEIAELVALGEWEDIAKRQAEGKIKNGSSSTLVFMLKNRFNTDYKDKSVVEHSGNVNWIIDTGIRRPGDEGYIEPPQKEPKEEPIEAEFTEITEDSDLL